MSTHRFPTRLLLYVAGLSLVIGGVGCAGRRVAQKPDYYRKLPPGIMALEKITDPKDYPDFAKGFYEKDGLVDAIDRSIDYLANHPSSQKYFPYLDITHERAVNSLLAFRKIVLETQNPEDFKARIVSDFDVYRSVGADESHVVLFTAYCQPILNGSLTKSGEYQYPLYSLPPDIVKDDEGRCLGRRDESGQLVPYYTRKQIDGDGVLADKGLELVYLADPLDAYVAQVQGSALIRLLDGKLLEIGYAGKNEYPYTSVGLALVEEGKLKEHELSLQGIRNYFQAKPKELYPSLFRNESYVFFRPTSGGPFGCLNQRVTPHRTLATDKGIFPRACIAYVETRLPTMGIGRTVHNRPFNAFMLDQDTGGAIRTPGRADIFMGTGPDAERLAGRTFAEGKLYYIFLKPNVTPPNRDTMPAAASRDTKPSG